VNPIFEIVYTLAKGILTIGPNIIAIANIIFILVNIPDLSLVVVLRITYMAADTYISAPKPQIIRP
jgi:hypothetical protein